MLTEWGRCLGLGAGREVVTDRIIMVPSNRNRKISFRKKESV